MYQIALCPLGLGFLMSLDKKTVIRWSKKQKIAIISLGIIVFSMMMYTQRDWLKSTYYHYFDSRTGKWRPYETRKKIKKLLKEADDISKDLNLFTEVTCASAILQTNIQQRNTQQIHGAIASLEKILNLCKFSQGKISKRNCFLANKVLGDFYIEGGGGIDKNINVSIQYLKEALSYYSQLTIEGKYKEEQNNHYLKMKKQINVNLALCYFFQNNLIECEKYANAASDLGESMVWVTLAESSALKENHIFSEKCLDEGIKTKSSEIIPYIIDIYVFGRMVNVSGAEKTNGVVDYPKNIKKAVELIQEFENLNNFCIFYTAGLLYSYNELGWQVNAEKSIAYFTKALNLGSLDAAYELAVIYFDGLETVKKDRIKGKEYLLLAADKNHAEACFRAGLFYLNGDRGFTKDINKATFYLHRACEQEHENALIILGAGYVKGSYGLPKAEETGLELLNKAEKNNSIKASLILGYWYREKGKFTQAVKHFEKASVAGDSEGKYCLAEMYHTGSGVKQDLEKALELYQQAALQEHPKARAIIDLLRK